MAPAAQTKEHEEDTVNIPGQGRRKCEKKSRNHRMKKSKKIVLKAGNKAQKKQENCTQGVRSNKVSRLCHKAETGTLSHYMPSSFCSRRQRYQIIYWVVGGDFDDFMHFVDVYSLHI